MRFHRYPVPTQLIAGDSDDRARVRRTPGRGGVPLFDQPWRAEAACVGKPTAWWFDERGADPRAVTICASCPVKRPCLLWAVRAGEHGYWGGMTDRQRHRWAKGRAA